MLGAFAGQQCLGDMHSDVLKKFYNCAQQIEDAQLGAQLMQLAAFCGPCRNYDSFKQFFGTSEVLADSRSSPAAYKHSNSDLGV